MKYLLILFLFGIITCQAQVKFATLPTPYKVYIDTMKCMEWFDLYHQINGDITFIRFKEASVETMVHHYKCTRRYVTFSLYSKRDYNDRVIITRNEYKVLRRTLVKT